MDDMTKPRIKVPARSQVVDTYGNLLTGIGGPRDKGPSSTYFFLQEMNQQQIDAAYRGDWIARKAITIPADDSTREWRSWQAEQDQITALEETEKKFKVQENLHTAMLYGRAYGGGALVIGTNDNEDMSQPLEPEKVKKDSLEFLHAVSKFDLNCGEIIRDWTDPWYGRPAYYEQRNGGIALPGLNKPNIRLHPSRVIPFFGSERLDVMNVGGTQIWSDTILLAIADAVKSAGVVGQTIAHLISECKLDIINVPELTESLSSVDGEERITKRFVYANTMKSVINAIILDGEEKWERLQLDFTGLPDLIMIYLMIVAGAVDIPATRFLSQSPKGLNATGESDIRNHYDRISSEQTNNVQPKINPLDEILIRSTFGSRDKSIFYTWDPLWQMTDKEKAEIAYNKAQAFKIDNDSHLINMDALRKGRINQLVEDGVYPGLEDAIEEFGEEPEDAGVDPTALAIQRLRLAPPANGGGLPGGNPQQRALPPPRRDSISTRLGDAIPKPLCVYRELTASSARGLQQWAESAGFDTSLLIKPFYVEIFESDVPVDWMRMGADDWGPDGSNELVVSAGGPRAVEKTEEGVALLFASNRLRYRHESLCAIAFNMEYGTETGFEASIPLVEASGNLDLSKIEPYRGELRFGPEIFEKPDDEEEAA